MMEYVLDRSGGVHESDDMITTSHSHGCRKCGRLDIVKNGHHRSGSQQYLCKDGRAVGVLTPQPPRYRPERREEILAADHERPSMRGDRTGLRRVPQHAVGPDQKKVRTLPSLKATLTPATPEDVPELDDVRSFVRKRAWKRWLWVVVCRRTRQVIAFVIGDRSARTCRRLWRRIPAAYRRCVGFSDFRDADAEVFPKETHRCVGKATGETAQIERWNTTLRQRVGRYVRKTLSFSERDRWHDRITEWFMIMYNSSLRC